MLIGGIDEVGAGPLAGPVLAVMAVFDREEPPFSGIKDSKKMTHKQRTDMFYPLREAAVEIGWGIVEAPEIDRRNILNARMRAMLDSLYMVKHRPDMLYIDGTEVPYLLPSLKMKVIAKAKADSLIWQVSAASIIAKVMRDEIMADLDRKYPGYNWSSNSGYGTDEHRAAILSLGMTPQHRRTFCKKLLGE